MWRKVPIQLPFLEEISAIFSTLKSGSDTISALLDTFLVGLQVAQALYNAKSDPFLAIFQALLTQLENLINDTYNTGVYSLTVDPREVAAPNLLSLNAAFATDISIVKDDGSVATPSEIAARVLALEEAGLDPELTYENMRAKVTEKRESWQFDQFGIPLMTPSQCVNHMISSFDDSNDPKRPIFSADAEVAAFGVIVSAPDVNDFIALAQPLLDVLDLQPLVGLLNELLRRTDQVTAEPSGGTAPDWTDVATLADIGFMRSQRDALLGALNQVRGATESADAAVNRLFEIIEQKITALDDTVERFSSLLETLQNTLNAEGVYVFDFDASGGSEGIKTSLKEFEDSASDLFTSSTGYTFGFLMVGGGPSLTTVQLIKQLLLDLRTQALVGGANDKQQVSYSTPSSGSLTINGQEVTFPKDNISLRQELQDAVNADPGSSEALVLLNDEGFTVEYQGADGRQSKPNIDFSFPGLDEIQEICFNEPPTSGTFTLNFNGIETSPIPFNATASILEGILNDTEGLYNCTSVTGSFVDCFQITFKNKAVPELQEGSNSLVGPGGAVSITISTLQEGENPSSNLKDENGKDIDVTVTKLVEGRRNDPCDEE
jgi:hypothetical protein